jgi:choline dehydrogenase-like flavoprotein
LAELFDVVVVGSGATGGWAAMDLAERGLRVAVLEAGPLLLDRGLRPPPPHDPERQRIQANCFAYDETTAQLFVDDVDNPYTHPADSPFLWIRGRQAGGRALLWDRLSLRMSDHELKAADRDGIGDPWPISYADLAPHYDRVERAMDVHGTPEGNPQVPDGPFAEALPISAGERQFKAAVEGRWPDRTVTSARIAKAPPERTLQAAMRTGRLTLLVDSIASRVNVSPDGRRATGVAYLDAGSGAEREVEGRVVVLCASTIESTRLLLNSAGEQHPDGLANSSGTLGRYLMDHIHCIGLDGAAPSPPRGMDDPLSDGCYIPSFRGIDEPGEGFARGYGIALQIAPREGGFLSRLAGSRRGKGGWFWIRACGEVLPNRDNRITIDPEKVDAWGIPAVHLECRYGENERAMAADQVRTMRELAEVANLEAHEVHSELKPPGFSIHEIGTARMGSDPESSVLDPHNRAWDVPNLYVTDGSCFVSGGFQNPTLTMLAITARACDHVAATLREGGPPGPR